MLITVQCVWQRHSSSKHESKQTSLERSYVFECSRCFGFGIVYAETRWVLIFKNIRKPNKQKTSRKPKKTEKQNPEVLGMGGWNKSLQIYMLFSDVFFCFCFVYFVFFSDVFVFSLRGLPQRVQCFIFLKHFGVSNTYLI